MKGINRMDIFGGLVMVMVIILAYRMYSRSETANLKCVIAGKDGNKYCVRDRDDVPKAANLMADVKENMSKLVKHLENKHRDKPHCERIIESFDGIRIVETLPTSVHTAYSENKGEKIALCLNKKQKTGDKKLIDLNTLTFVALHELAHVGTKSEGHKPEFWNNFKFLLEEASSIGIYEPIDYKKENTSYCGDTLTDNPLFDL